MSIDQSYENIKVLISAQATFSSLLIIRKYMLNDVDQAFVALAIILRTRCDVISSTYHYNKVDKILEFEKYSRFYTSINEISKFTQINRAIVRRKMQNLERLNMIEKFDTDKWCFKEVVLSDDVPIANMLRELLYNSITTTHKLKDSIHIDEMASIFNRAPLDVSAMLEKDVIKKTKRGMAIGR